MVMKRNTAILFLFTVCVFGIWSCRKEKGAETPYDRIQGKWQLIKTATDDNQDGNISNSEIFPVSPQQINQLLFNKDGTGVETNTYSGVASPSLNFRWQIVGNDSVWCAYSGHDTLTFYLAAVSSGNLALTTNTTHGLAWYYYIKK